MKKSLYITLFVAIISLISASSAKAQVSIIAHASAEIIEALTATENSTLNFGRFSPETSGGEIILTPDGVRTATSSVALIGGTYNPATFVLTGQNESIVTIALPAASALLTNSTNGKTLEVYNWKSYPEAGIGTGVLINGLLSVNVGATLKVGDIEKNPVGIYSGTYTVTFSYN